MKDGQQAWSKLKPDSSTGTVEGRCQKKKQVLDCLLWLSSKQNKIPTEDVIKTVKEKKGNSSGRKLYNKGDEIILSVSKSWI